MQSDNYSLFSGQVFETHKLMLCACSTFFRSILTKRPDRHPIVFLKDVDPKQLEQLLQYMYQVGKFTAQQFYFSLETNNVMTYR